MKSMQMLGLVRMEKDCLGTKIRLEVLRYFDLFVYQSNESGCGKFSSTILI